jgi:GT2 family glycosyltransferase
LEKGGHPNVELVVVYDIATPKGVLEELKVIADECLLLVPYDKPFNFSEKCNLGVVAAHGEVLVLLNDDVEIASEGFLVQLAAPLFESGVGVTGARLLYPDSTIQHAGLAFYRRHLSHMFYHLPNSDPGPFNALVVSRECSGLTGACLAVLKTVYEEVGGFTEALPVNYNDCDFSFKMDHLGYRRVWVANTLAFHFESQTRVAVVQDWEHAIMHKRWLAPEQDTYVPDYGLTRGDVRPKALRARNG